MNPPFQGFSQVSIMMSSPAGLQQGQFHFLSQWMPDSSHAGVILHGSPGEAGSGSVRSSGSLVVQDPDDSFSCQFAPLPLSRNGSCASVDVCSPGGGGKTLRETDLFDASLNSEMQSIQDVLRNTRDLPLIAKLGQVGWGPQLILLLQWSCFILIRVHFMDVLLEKYYVFYSLS